MHLKLMINCKVKYVVPNLVQPLETEYPAVEEGVFAKAKLRSVDDNCINESLLLCLSSMPGISISFQTWHFFGVKTALMLGFDSLERPLEVCICESVLITSSPTYCAPAAQIVEGSMTVGDVKSGLQGSTKHM